MLGRTILIHACTIHTKYQQCVLILVNGLQTDFKASRYVSVNADARR